MDLTPLTMVVDGHAIFFSACDAHHFKSSVHITKCRSGGPNYVRRNKTRIHRLILGLTADDKVMVDHINRNGLDNRRENLRLATCSQNQFNKGAIGRTSSFKGVSLAKKNNKWQALVCKDKKLKWLGYFLTELEAAQAYDNAAVILHGEFALLNFPRASLSI
jgi:hypothetical protein